MTIGKLSFLVLFLMFSYTERERVFINDETEEFILTIQEIPILVDSAGTLDFEQVLSQPREFNIHPQFKPQDYCISCVYWIKIPLLVGKSTKKQWMLEFYDQTIDQITAYFPQEDGSYSSEAVGDFFPFHEKGFMHKNFEWLLDTDITGHQDIYFRIESHTYADVRIAVRTVNRFIYYSLNEYFLYGLFYGMIFIITVYNLLMFSAIRERMYLFYTFYIISVGIYAMCVDGIAFQYLWPNSPEWNQIAYGTARFSLIFWSLLFARRFLNTATRAPRLDVLFKIVILSRVLFFLYTFWLDHDLFEFTSVEILPLTLIFYSSIHVLLRGYQPARFFVVAFGFLFLGFLIKALLHLSVIPFVILSYYSLHICFLFEMLFLTFALSDRVRILIANRDRALIRIIIQHQDNSNLTDKVNKELEEKIKQRTKELEQKNLQLADTNQRLYEQTNEINRINSTLDLDNWKLKNNIKEILQDRLINKNLTLEQFQKVFPDQISCYKFLDKLKWDNGYHCSRCDNTKYSKGQSKFSRRCSRCGYDESITSNTVFHRIKFPIEKAFYILYVTNNRQNDYTLDELSEMLDLRRNTVWSFKKKIEEIYSSGKGKASAVLVQNLFSTHLN